MAIQVETLCETISPRFLVAQVELRLWIGAHAFYLGCTYYLSQLRRHLAYVVGQ
eukprot:COSAG06_NODE_28172_length_579_cov_0.852083_1_plen_53_part_10